MTSFAQPGKEVRKPHRSLTKEVAFEVHSSRRIRGGHKTVNMSESIDMENKVCSGNSKYTTDSGTYVQGK